MTKPTYLYKLIPPSERPPEQLPDRLPLSELDLSSGFIHLSTAVQVPGTLKHFFANESHIHVLRLEYTTVEKDIKWEDPKIEVCGERGGEGTFPHLYNGGRLGKHEVESQAVLENDGTGWDTALTKVASWLVQ